MTKIVFVHLLNDFSGSPKVLSQVIKACETEENTIELYTGKGTRGFLSNLTKNNYFYYYKRFNNKFITLISFMFSQIDLMFKLVKYRNQEVVFYVNTLLPFGAGLAGKLLNKEVIYHIHETSIRPSFFKAFLREIVSLSASKIIFVSKSLRSSETFSLDKERVIFNALPRAFFKKAKETPYTRGKNNFTILMVCSLKLYKGVLEFLKIANECKQIASLQFQLVLNSCEQEVEEFISQYSPPNNISFFSSQEDLHPFYANSNLVMNLSRVDEWEETFGLTIIEALAYGNPVIVPPIGGPAEIVRDGVEGFLINSYEVKVISDKIKYLHNHPEECMKLSERARKRANEFTEETFNKQVLDYINE